MTKEDWQKLRGWWDSDSIYSSFKLQCDEHEVSLHFEVYKKKINVIIYVDGWLKGEWLNLDNPIGQKFLQRHKKAYYTAKELKKYAKVFGKKHELAQQKYYEWVSVSWSSFSAFKKHISTTCKDIKIIEE